MRFTSFFIDRPIFATVLSLLLMVAGGVALFLLPVSQFPDITPPTVQVSTTYPGANATTVAQTVGIPIEQQVNGVEGMMYMSSSSTSSGQYTLTVTFEVGTDVDMAMVQVQNRVNQITSTLPDAVNKQGVTVRKQSGNIVLLVTLTGDGEQSGLYLSNYARLQLVNPLTRVPGVGDVQVMGVGNYSMRVWLNPEQMRIRGVTAADILDAITQQNMAVSAGSVGVSFDNNLQTREPDFEYPLTVRGRLTTPEEFGNIAIKVNEQGEFLRIADVARVELGSQAYNMSSTVKGQEAAVIAIYQTPGSNATEVAEAVRARMEEWKEDLPPGVTYEVALDTTRVVHSSIVEVLKTLLEATILVVIVIFFFLRNLRATLIPCITIPVSLIGTLAFMELLGYSINTLTLFGLILAIAIVVDDAIVVTENASRLLATGRYATAREAVKVAMAEITGPIIGVVLVLLAVFVPTIFMAGIMGQLYKQFAMTIAISTVISGFNSLTLSPALCALLLRREEAKEERKSPFVVRLFDAIYNKVQEGFDAAMHFLLRRRALAAVSFAAMVVLAGWLFLRWPTTFLPDEDNGYFIVAVQLPASSSLHRTRDVNQEVDALLRTYPEVESFVGMAGFSLLGGGQQSNASTYFVILKDWNKRRGKQHSAQAVVERFNKEAYVKIQQANCYALVSPPIPGLGNAGGLELELEDRKGVGGNEMQQAIRALQESVTRRCPSIASLTTQYQADNPQYQLNIDRDKALMLGLNMQQIFATVGYFMGQTYINDFVEFDRIYQVRFSVLPDAQVQVGDVLAISLENDKGEMVPFSSFTTLEEVMGMSQVTRYNMYDAAQLTATVSSGYGTGEAIQQMDALFREEIGNAMGMDWTAIAYQEIKAGGTVFVIFLLSILIAYLVLCAQYESWTSPIAAVSGVPIALLGAILGCAVMGIPVSIYTQIGIILLIALSAKNGILIVEFARDYRKLGYSVRESAYQAGHIRLRPILMTSLSFVFGVMPLLFATGAGAAGRESLGAAVVFGMLLNTVVATLYIPSWFEWVQKESKNPALRNKKAEI
jgi:HAE1 family hydrophobic/amphiphilic exporter-1